MMLITMANTRYHMQTYVWIFKFSKRNDNNFKKRVTFRALALVLFIENNELPNSFKQQDMEQ